MTWLSFSLSFEPDGHMVAMAIAMCWAWIYEAQLMSEQRSQEDRGRDE